MTGFREHLDESLKDPAFRHEWSAQETEREVMKSIVKARIAAGLTQKELADRCGMKAANLCRLENGNGNPSVATLSKIATVSARSCRSASCSTIASRINRADPIWDRPYRVIIATEGPSN